MAAARPDTWMPLYWGDYAKDTGHLGAAQHGAYLMLIKHYWVTGRPLPDDDGQLWRVACADSLPHWRKLKPVVMAFFHLVDGAWHHGRIDAELGRAGAFIDQRAAAGRASAEARKKQREGNTRSTPVDRPLGSPLQREAQRKAKTSQSPSQSHEEAPPAAAYPPASARDAAAAAAPPDPEDQLDIPERLDWRPRPFSQAAMAEQALVDEAYQLWLTVAYELGISDVGHLNRDRRAALGARLAEVGGIEGWRAFIAKVREAEFLRDDNGRPKFWVGLAKLLEPEHFSKVLEGRYAERHDRQGKSGLSDSLEALAEFGRTGTG